VGWQERGRLMKMLVVYATIRPIPEILVETR
jgi:hypothetical protein